MLNLTGSKLRKKLLGLYFANVDSSFYVRELAKILDVDSTNLSRALSGLETKGLFTSEMRGKQKYYKLNKSFPGFKEWKSLIGKTIGVVGILRDVFAKIKEVKLVLLYGSFASNQEDQASDVDVFVVSDLDSQNFFDLLPELEAKLGREINFTIYSKKEFESKKKRKDIFLLNILSNKHEIITGKI